MAWHGLPLAEHLLTGAAVWISLAHYQLHQSSGLAGFGIVVHPALAYTLSQLVLVVDWPTPVFPGLAQKCVNRCYSLT